MNKHKDSSKSFIKDLFDFLKSRGQSNLRVPLIGAKELDLYALYQSVVKRGGAENVSTNKLWKEIVNEFDLPSTCTSASFTLKNHYQKYLLAYEQKFFFKKDEGDMIRELGNLRNKRHKGDGDITLGKRSEPDGLLDFAPSKTGATFSLQETLMQIYADRLSANDQIFYIKKKRLVPYSSEIKRIIIALESKIASEVRYTLNSLMVYSCSKHSPFFLENYRVLYNELVNYLGFVMKNLWQESTFILPHGVLENGVHRSFLGNGEKINGAYNHEQNQNIAKNDDGSDRNFDKEFVKRQNNNEMLVMDAMSGIENISKCEMLEQIKIILMIFRNLLLIKANETFVCKNNHLIDLFYDCFLYNNDNEVNRLMLEIFSVLSRYIILKDNSIDKEKLFLDKIIVCLNSDFEYELGVENLHNLMMNQENENILEGSLVKFISPLIKLLVCNFSDVVERVLEIICHFSDLKISTRVMFAKQKFFFSRLVALMVGNASKSPDKLSRIAAIIINNVIITPASRIYLKPHEKSLFAVASVNGEL
jgi:hypothetical protein